MHKFYCTAVVIIISFLMLSEYVPVIQCVPGNASINVPHSTNAANIDGQWTISSEWTDASEFKLFTGDSNAYFRSKENSSYLFLLVDFVSDQTGSLSDSIATFDYCGFFFDVANDGGFYPKSDDYFLSHYYISSTYKSGLQTYVSQGTGSNKEDNNWKQIETPQGFILERGFSSTNDPYQSSKNHRIYEAAVPLSFFNYGNLTGFYLFVRDANSGLLLEFPHNAGGESIRSDSMANVIAPKPESWGTLFFSQSNVPTPTSSEGLSPTPTSTPDFSISSNEIILIVMVIVGIAIIVLIVSQKKN
jgi:hypothetical protein